MRTFPGSSRARGGASTASAKSRERRLRALLQRGARFALPRFAAYPTSFDASTFFMYQAMRRETGLRSAMPSTAAGTANATKMPR